MSLSLSYARSRFALAAFAVIMAFIGGAMGMASRAAAAPDADKTAIKLGVIEGDELEVWQTAIRYAKQHEGLDITLVPFSEYILPNEALNSGELDANAFQHKAYLDAQIASRGYKISIAGDTSLYPMSVYSRQVKNLADLPAGATIGIPDDPSNEGRALRLLAEKGLITLDDPNNILVTPINIKNNPKNFRFQEMDAGILGRAINDMGAVVVTNSWVTASGLNPEDLITQESPENNPYVNFIAVRSADIDKPWVKKLVASFQNEEVYQAIERVFGKRAIAPWHKG